MFAILKISVTILDDFLFRIRTAFEGFKKSDCLLLSRAHYLCSYFAEKFLVSRSYYGHLMTTNTWEVDINEGAKT